MFIYVFIVEMGIVFTGFYLLCFYEDFRSVYRFMWWDEDMLEKFFEVCSEIGYFSGSWVL